MIDISGKAIKKLDLDRIRVTTNARVEENLERIEFFKSILDDGGKLDPIYICNGGEMIDGRSRLAAHVLAKKTTINVIDFGKLDKTEIFFLALEANSKGPLPATPKDYERVVVQLLGLKVEREVIITRVADMGLGKYATKIYEGARRVFNRDNARSAAKLVRAGKATPEDAAKEFNVNKSLVLAELGEKKTKKTGAEYCVKIKSDMKSTAKRYTKQFGVYIEKTVTDLFLNGDISKKQVEDIIKFGRGRIESFNKHTTNTIERLENLMAAK